MPIIKTDNQLEASFGQLVAFMAMQSPSDDKDNKDEQDEMLVRSLHALKHLATLAGLSPDAQSRIAYDVGRHIERLVAEHRAKRN